MYFIWRFKYAAIAALVGTAGAQSPIAPLAGAFDIHCHSAPDTVARSVNSFEVVRQARASGMRGVVLKNHFASTAAVAQLAMQEVGNIEVFGGIVLNRANGGLNAEAVQRMTQVEGRRGRIVWLPTFDAENQIKFFGEQRPFVPVMRDGRLLPELIELFAIVAQADLVLATGHSSPVESLQLIEAARAAGVKRLLVTHVLTDPCRATIDQMKQFARMGALLEVTWLAHLGGPSGPVPGAASSKPVPIADCARAIKDVGAESFILSSDLGQANNPLHPAGLSAFISALQADGIGWREIELMTRRNPARLLGVEP
jgi:hypothetical protein